MSKSTEKAPKVKKEKSSKKKSPVEEVIQVDAPSETPIEEETEPVKTKKEKKSSKQNKDTEVDMMDTALTEDTEKSPDSSITKKKKDKSSKKRKAEESDPDPTITPNTSQSADTNDNDSDSPSDTERPSKKRKSVLPETEIEVDVTAPEPPSKKALRLLKKGKPLPKSKSGADPLGTVPGAEDALNDDDKKEPKKEVEKRSEHGIWIGNLPWSVTKEMLQNFFVENSNIELVNITRVHMPSPDDSKPANRVNTDPSWKRQHNKGFAYVDFSTAENAEEAVTLSEQLLQGRRVLIKNNKSFDGRPMKATGDDATKDGGKPPSKRIFIGNLRFDATNASIAEHFEQCGPIEDCMLATFEDSGKCKGYGWITFETLEAAEQAVKGWVPYYDEESDDSDSDSSSSASSDDDSEASDVDSDAEVSKPKKVKKPARAPRRRYIDKIAGRPVRREFAEPPQVRYKKRYGKDGTKQKATEAKATTGGEVVEKPQREKPAKEYESLGKSYAPRLTGAIRKAEGKKVTF